VVGVLLQRGGGEEDRGGDISPLGCRAGMVRKENVLLGERGGGAFSLKETLTTGGTFK